jgi:hypothetical protein
MHIYGICANSSYSSKWRDSCAKLIMLSLPSKWSDSVLYQWMNLFIGCSWVSSNYLVQKGYEWFQTIWKLRAENNSMHGRHWHMWHSLVAYRVPYRIRHNYQVLFLKFFGGSCSPREVPSLLLKHQKMHGHRRSFIPNTWSLYLQRTKKKPVSVKKLEPFRERQQSTGTNTSQNTAKQNRCQDNQKGRAAKHRTQAVPMCHASHWPEKKRF